MLHLLKKHMDQRSTIAARTQTLLIHEDTSINSVVSYDRAFSSMMQNTQDSPPIANTTTEQPNSLTFSSTTTTTDVPARSAFPSRADDTYDNSGYRENLVHTPELDLPTNWGQGSCLSDEGTVSGLTFEIFPPPLILPHHVFYH